MNIIDKMIPHQKQGGFMTDKVNYPPSSPSLEHVHHQTTQINHQNMMGQSKGSNVSHNDVKSPEVFYS
jgi:hypothetical protein